MPGFPVTPVRDLLRTAGDAVVNAAARVAPLERLHPRVARLRAATARCPLLLQIETTNVCNAACGFCAYPSMKRPKGVMSLSLFEKVVREYAEAGGGPVSLTPITGDALLDPHLMERVRVLERTAAVNQLTLTTNGIALARYSDAEVDELLTAVDVVQLSVGGLDADTYERMYGVRQFHNVSLAMRRVLDRASGLAAPPRIAFAFRTSDPRFLPRFRTQLEELKRRGAFVSHISTFANWGGVLEQGSSRGMTIVSGSRPKRRACAVASVHMAVCHDGTVSACGCADVEGRSLILGDANEQSMAALWTSEKRTRMLAAFEAGSPPGICRECSAYQPDTAFARSSFSGVEPGRPLPAAFFHEFYGG